MAKRFCIFIGIFILSIGPLGSQNITVNNDLSFGNVYPGIPKVVSKYSPGTAAEFFISGLAGSEVSIQFTNLPTYVNSGGFNMPLLFNETDCSVDSSATPDQSSPTLDNQDPWHPITYRLGSNGLTVWLGGMLVPKLVQSPGNYTATVVLTVSYTGN